jgi:hypothetical protein
MSPKPQVIGVFWVKATPIAAALLRSLTQSLIDHSHKYGEQEAASIGNV